MAKNHSGKLDERLLGFDARKMWLDPEIHWHKERRDHFLLRMDAGPVLSTDEIVWPSVFASHQMPLVSESQLEALGLAGSHRPAWIGPNIPLWDDLNRLKAHLGGKDPEIKQPYWIIAHQQDPPPPPGKAGYELMLDAWGIKLPEDRTG